MAKTKELQHLSLATTYEVDNTFDSDKFIKMRLRVCHDGTNPNKSNFEKDDMEKAKDSAKNIPILAHVIVDADGNPQFGGHDYDVEQSKIDPEKQKVIYKEVPIGVVPESNNHEIKEFNGMNYVYVDAYIWRDYSNYAEDIIERDENIKLSMEILVDKYSYDGKEKVYNITEYRYQGITFLNNNYGTGMKDALATVETFAEDDAKQNMVIMMAELKKALSDYDNKESDKGGSCVDEKVIALLESFGVKAEDLTFEYETLTFEELELKLKEIYGKQENPQADEPKADPPAEPEKFVLSYELSHGEIRYALYQLLSATMETDNEWYFIDQVYDDKFEYENWEGTKIYRQTYKRDGDDISFDGDRIEVFQERLTKEEKEALEEMRNKYSALIQEFEEYKNKYSIENVEAERLQAFEKNVLEQQRTIEENTIFETYDALIDTDDESYKTIKENKSNYTIEELEKELALIYARTKVVFAQKQTGKVIKLGKTDGNTGDVSPYGNMFEKHSKLNKEDN